MWKQSTSILMAGLTLGGLLLMGSTAGAEPYYNSYNIDQREDNQQYRIQQGIDSGSLTPGESRYLEKEQARIQAAEDRMRADGHLSPWERQRLRRMQDEASRDIYRLEHNGRTAEGWDNGHHHGWSRHHNSGWDGRDYGGWGGYGYDPQSYRRPGYTSNQASWQGNNNAWSGRGYWQGNNSGSYGTTPSGTSVTDTSITGTTTTGNTYGWRGYRSGGNGSSSSGTGTSGTTTAGTSGGTNSGTTGGTTTASSTQGWRGNRSAGNGYTPGGTAANVTSSGTTSSGTTGAGNTQGWYGNYNRRGQAGPFQQPVARTGSSLQTPNWQGQPRFQQARPPMPQAMMRQNANMMARQPGGLGGAVNRLNSAAKAVYRKR